MSQPKQRPRKIVPVVVAIILDEMSDSVLLQRREHTTGVEGMDGMWEMPGGKIEYGEQPDEALKREIWEELGIEIKIKRLLGICTNLWRFPEFEAHSLLIGFHCQPVEPHFHENEKQRWFRISDLNYTTTLPGTREFIESVWNRQSQIFRG